MTLKALSIGTVEIKMSTCAESRQAYGPLLKQVSPVVRSCLPVGK